MIEKESAQFNFNYHSKNIPSKLKSNIDKIFYYGFMALAVGLIIFEYFKPLPDIHYYNTQDIVIFSTKVNNDIQKEMNNKPLTKIDHIRYGENGFNNIKEITSNFKKENNNIDFLPTAELKSVAKVEIKHVDKSGDYVRYEVTMPYIEKRIINKKEVKKDKSFIYTIYQARYRLSVGGIEINETK